MTLEDVKTRVQAVQAESDDDEKAHGMEDDLWADVLRAVAQSGDSEMAQLAAEALKTQEIEFSRWCA